MFNSGEAQSAQQVRNYCVPNRILAHLRENASAHGGRAFQRFLLIGMAVSFGQRIKLENLSSFRICPHREKLLSTVENGFTRPLISLLRSF